MHLQLNLCKHVFGRLSTKATEAWTRRRARLHTPEQYDRPLQRGNKVSQDAVETKPCGKRYNDSKLTSDVLILE